MRHASSSRLQWFAKKKVRARRVLGSQIYNSKSLLDQVVHQLKPQRLVFGHHSPRIHSALGVEGDRHSQPSRVEVAGTWRHRGAGEDSRVASPVVGRGSIGRCGRGKSGSRLRLMDL